MQKSHFYQLIPWNIPVKGSIWQTTQGITCNLVDYLHIHIDYHVVPSVLILSYYSVVADREQRDWLQHINRDESAGCSLIYHISKLSHHPVGYQYLHLE